MSRLFSRLSQVAMCVALLSVFGCGGNNAPPATIDVNVARESLQRALTAWKDQAQPQSLMQDAASPVHVADEDWIMGFKLQAFEVASSEPMPITSACVRFEVKLELTSPKGQRVQKKAEYSVTTSPSISVVRAETNA
jgi:hypothetical protein